MLSVLPSEKLASVAKALRCAFGTTEADSIALLTGGLSSALVYKIVVRGAPYVLRVIMRIDGLNDPPRQYACMRVAADAGIAPRVLYANPEDALSITEFLDHRPLSENFATHLDLLKAVGRTIRSIHETPLFPPLVNYLDGVDMFISQFHALRILPEAATAECFRGYAEIQRAYPRHDPDLVSSHNDLNPNNILGGNGKLWIIDWEAAFRNDRYVDLGNVANSFVTTEVHETTLLEAYFGAPPDDYQRARLFLMRQVCNMFYAMVFVQFAAATGATLDPEMNLPTLDDFKQQIMTGQVKLNGPRDQFRFAKVLLNEIARNTRTPRFAESIARMESH